MFRQINLRNVPVVFFALTMMLGVPQVRASDPTCDDDGGPYVCVSWSQGAAPVELTDFEFDFSDPDKPDVTLIRQDSGWVVWSQVSSGNTNPAALGDLLLNPENNDDDFGVTLKNGANAGATTVESIILNYTTEEWTGYSNLDGKMSGNLNGNLIVKEDGSVPPVGGRANFDIGGDFDGTMDIYKIVTGERVSIGGDASGSITIDRIAGNVLALAALEVGGDLLADVDISVMDGGWVLVYEDVAAAVTVDVGEMTNWSALWFNYQNYLWPYTTTFTFAGDVVLQNGIPSTCGVLIVGETQSTASVNLTGDDVAGQLDFFRGGSGQILNGGAVSAYVRLAKMTYTFSGSAEFASVADGGHVQTDGSADLSGSVEISGAVAGLVKVSGDLNSTGDVSIGGDVSGDIDVDGDVDGDIYLGILGSTPDLLGSIGVGGALGANGRIIVWGACDGDITIGDETGSNSLIACYGGLEVDACIFINDDEGNGNDANGDIYVGQAKLTDPLLDVTFDGGIWIRDGSTSGGALEGMIEVVGCHADTNDLDICIDGGGEGTIDIVQDGCENQVDHDCVGGCY